MSDRNIHLDDIRLTLRSRAGPVEILRGLTLDVGAGGAVGVLGPSGSGKTTLLMVIAGLERVSSGTISVAGTDLGRCSEDDLARFRAENIGIVFQSFHLVPTMTALENVSLPLEFLDRMDAAERARAALHDVGLSHRLDHFPSQLSGGEQQRVALARALAPEPGLLLADEPTGNLDAANGAHVMDLMFDLRSRIGATLVLISHDQALAARCERIITLRDGRIESDSGPGRVDAEAGTTNDRDQTAPREAPEPVP